MATEEREVCSIDKSATGDEGVDRSFWRSLTLLPKDRRLVWEINTVRRWCVEIDRLGPSSLCGSNLTHIILQSVNFRHQGGYFHTVNVCDWVSSSSPLGLICCAKLTRLHIVRGICTELHQPLAGRQRGAAATDIMQKETLHVCRAPGSRRTGSHKESN